MPVGVIKVIVWSDGTDTWFLVTISDESDMEAARTLFELFFLVAGNVIEHKTKKNINSLIILFLFILNSLIIVHYSIFISKSSWDKQDDFDNR